MKKRITTHKELAEERAAILWVFYNKHGRLLCSDVFELTGKKSTNLYMTFEVHGIKAPPVWDTKDAIRKRAIAALWAKANELNRRWLSVEEAAEALDTAEKNVYGVRSRLGGRIPEIRNKVRGPRNIPLSRLPPCFENDTGEGLKVLNSRPGPQPGQVIYVLK